MVIPFRRIFIGWAVACSLLATALGETPVLAAPAPSPQPATAGTNLPAADAVQRVTGAIRLLDPYVVRRSDGTLALTPPSSVTNRVGPALMSKFQAGLSVVNGEIRAGRLVATSDHHLFNPADSALSIQGGWTGIRHQWWGTQFFIDEYWTQKLMAAITVGAAAAGVCAAIPALANQAPCALIAAVLALYVGILWLIDNGNGVVFNVTWWGFYWISAQ